MSERGRKFLYMIAAVIIAIAGWIYVVYNFYPNTNVTYRNIPITYEGEEELANRGLGITESNTDYVTVTLTQKRVETGSISADNISVVADVSDAIEGDNGIGLKISGPDGTTVKESSTRLITVSVDKVKTVEFDISVEFSDAAELGAEPIATNFSDETATLVGAGSELNEVDRVVAYLSISEMSESSRNFTRELVAVDAEGNELSHIVIYPSTVSFDAETGYTKTVTLNVNVEGQDDNGYTRTYEAPKGITIKGKADIIEEITSIDTKTINLANIYENKEIDLEYDLPDEVYIANDSVGGVIKVTSTETPEEEEE